MEPKNLRRRQFIKTSASALALTSFPSLNVLGQTTLAIRPEWQTLSAAQRTAYANAIGAMKSNSNASDPASMQYWATIHKNYCPHGVSYFAAWHRGFVYHFERQLRIVAGDSTMCVPYWNYYKYVTVPAEFSDPASPLYMDRLNTNVYSALSMTPFGSSLVNFPRGTTSAFEPSVEYKPHNTFHNIIGNTMATMLSPLDPLFWSHHAQIDRLWVAWVNLDSGRQMPPVSDTYWSGSFTYGASLSLPRVRTYDTRTYLGYRYDNETAPTALPSSTSAAANAMAAAEITYSGGVPPRPPVGNFKPLPPANLEPGRRSMGGAANIGLDERSVSVQIPLSAVDRAALQAAIEGPPGGKDAVSIQIVLDGLQLTGVGEKGGYFYNLYLDLPAGGGGAGSEDKYLLGGIGPFEINGTLQHHGMGEHHGSGQLAYEATLLLKMIEPHDLDDITISFIRFSGENTARGRTINIGELRAELLT